MTSTGVLALTNVANSGTVTSSIALALNTWYRIEVRQLLSTSVGQLELLINGASQGALTGINTLNGVNMNSFEFGDNNDSGNESLYYDDIAINDDSGTFQNSWPGAGNVALVRPAFNDSVAWAPSPASNTNAVNLQAYR